MSTPLNETRMPLSTDIEARRAVIFGGSGFIGTHLTLELASRGWEVIVADVVPPASELAKFEYCDVRTSGPIDLPGGAETVAFNLAAVHRTPGHLPSEYYDVNVRGAVRICEWASRTGVETIAFTSSISVYGPSEAPLTERSALNPVSDYGRSKLLGEEIHRWWSGQQPDRKLVTCRPAVVFGRGEGGNFSRLATSLSKGRFLIPGRRDVVKACGYVKDLTRSLLFALSSVRGEFLYNFALQEAPTLEEVCSAFASVAGYEVPAAIPEPVAGRAASMLRLLRPELSARVEKLRASTHVLPLALSASDFEWQYPTLSVALDDWRADAPAGAFV